MKRRSFIQKTTLTSLALGLAPYACSPEKEGVARMEDSFQALTSDLLLDWGNALVNLQIQQPEDSAVHGALACPACNKIHGRCMDAVYPLLYLADDTGESKYLDAAILLMEWSDNVSMPDGSWTVIPDPKSWRGITVFGAIALAEALHHHGHVLPQEINKKWLNRLAKAGEYIYENFDLVFTNINYGFTAVYALHLLGRVLQRPDYIDRSRTLAEGIKDWFTQPNHLLFGEAKPSRARSHKGLLGVDLGYNVEESLNGVVQYALAEKDESLLQLLTQSLTGHLQFMLPDGAWDNSWGTRQYKWSYWGSRTTDGCQPGFGLLAARSPVLGTAAFLNAELLSRCTYNGLLHGGLHYVSHGVQPCVHHTFTHAKALTVLLDTKEDLTEITKDTPLPRVMADGIREFPEIAVHLVAKGDFRATISTYDFIYKKHAQQGSGGSLCMLYHLEVGPLFAASMAKYLLVEPNNQQPNPNQEDLVLTPRLETFQNGAWYTNLYDLKAQVTATDHLDSIQIEVHTELVDESRMGPAGEPIAFQLNYLFEKDKVSIKAKQITQTQVPFEANLILPIISPSGEIVTQDQSSRIQIQKPNGTVVVEAGSSLEIIQTAKGRGFNMVPGMEALPIRLKLSETPFDETVCSITVES